MKDLALTVLETFKGDGLWTAERQKDGSFNMVKSKITSAQYDALISVFKNLNNSGFTPAEEEKRRAAQKEMRSVIK